MRKSSNFETRKVSAPNHQGAGQITTLLAEQHRRSYAEQQSALSVEAATHVTAMERVAQFAGHIVHPAHQPQPAS